MQGRARRELEASTDGGSTWAPISEAALAMMVSDWGLTRSQIVDMYRSLDRGRVITSPDNARAGWCYRRTDARQLSLTTDTVDFGGAVAEFRRLERRGLA